MAFQLDHGAAAAVAGKQAAYYYHFGIDKYPLKKKLFGVFRHRVMNRRIPLVRGFDDVFYAPHSRHTQIDPAKIKACEDLMVLAESDEAGVFLAMTKDGKIGRASCRERV